MMLGTFKTPTRSVRCYHCQSTISVAPKAVQLTCPACYKPIRVDDIVVEREQASGQVRTCGVVVVGQRGSLSASFIEANQGVHVLGRLSGRVVSGGPVVIGPKAVWDGDCQALSIVIQPGATIVGGRFSIVGPTRGPGGGSPSRSAGRGPGRPVSRSA